MIDGSCHCGAIQWRAPAPEKLSTCNCSYCDRVGAEWAYTTPEQFTLRTAPEALSVYQFGTYTGIHYHCANCGCATHGSSPDYSSGKADPSKTIIGYNVRTAHDFDRSSLPVERHNGAQY